MNERKSVAWNTSQLLGFALFLLLAIAAFHLANAAKGRAFYRDIHLGAALEFAKGRIDLFNPVIVGFNATQTPTPQELPLWQAAAALGFKILGPWFGWANVVSLLLFSTCLFPLYQLAALHGGKRLACWTLVFFLAEPLVFFQSGMGSTDGFSLAVAIWFLYCAVKLLRSPGPAWWLLTAFTGVIAALSKLPFFMSAGLAIFFLTALFHRNSLRPWLWLGTAAGVIGVVFLLWTKHTDQCIKIAVFPYVDLRLSNPEMKFWYFGDWHYRLSPSYWIKGGWRVINACFGGSALLGLFLLSLLFVRQHVFARLWLLGALFTMLVFSHLVLHHWHYYLMFTPAIALICAQAAVACEAHISFGNRLQAWAGFGVVVAGLLLAIAQGLVAMKIVLHQDPYVTQTVEIIKQHTKESDKIVIGGGAWGGEELFRSHRVGLSIHTTRFLEDPANCEQLKKLGFTKLVMISESPLQIALQQGNLGEAKHIRRSYHEDLTPGVEKWTTLYETEDFLIKELP